MVSLTKLLRIRQGIGKKYKNMGLEKFLLSNGNFEIFKIMKIIYRAIFEKSAHRGNFLRILHQVNAFN